MAWSSRQVVPGPGNGRKSSSGSEGSHHLKFVLLTKARALGAHPTRGALGGQRENQFPGEPQSPGVREFWAPLRGERKMVSPFHPMTALGKETRIKCMARVKSHRPVGLQVLVGG